MASPYSSLQWQATHAQPVQTPVKKRVRSTQSKHLSTLELSFRLLIVAALLFGILQSVRALTTGAYKMTALLKNQAIVSQSLEEAREEGAILGEKIDTYSSPAGIEELARNSLQMVGKDEVLVRIH